MKEFKRKHQEGPQSNNARSLRRLRTACESAKRTLSSAAQSAIEIDSLFEGIDFNTTLTKRALRGDEHGLLPQVHGPRGEGAPRTPNCPSPRSTRSCSSAAPRASPRCSSLLKDFFNGKEPCKSINPDEAVAYGATVQAAILGR